MSLWRHQCNSETDKFIIVIGSGPIGATYAKEILDPKHGIHKHRASRSSPKVIMVEAGAQWDTSTLFVTASLPTRHVTNVWNAISRESKIPGDHKKNAVTFQKDIDSFVK